MSSVLCPAFNFPRTRVENERTLSSESVRADFINAGTKVGGSEAKARSSLSTTSAFLLTMALRQSFMIVSTFGKIAPAAWDEGATVAVAADPAAVAAVGSGNGSRGDPDRGSPAAGEIAVPTPSPPPAR
jgi:hypothetical protein